MLAKKTCVANLLGACEDHAPIFTVTENPSPATTKHIIDKAVFL